MRRHDHKHTKKAISKFQCLPHILAANGETAGIDTEEEIAPGQSVCNSLRPHVEYIVCRPAGALRRYLDKLQFVDRPLSVCSNNAACAAAGAAAR